MSDAQPGYDLNAGTLAAALVELRKIYDSPLSYRIMWRKVNTDEWHQWRVRSVDAIDDLRSYCFREGGEDNDYKCTIVDAANKRAKFDKLNAVGEEYFFGSTAQMEKPAEDDVDLAEQKKKLKREEDKLRIEARQMEVDRQRAELERKKKAAESGDGADGGGLEKLPPGTRLKVGINGKLYIDDAEESGGKSDRFEIMLEMMRQDAERRDRAAERSQQLLLGLIPTLLPLLMRNDGIKIADMMPMMSGFLVEGQKAAAQSNRMLFEALSDVQGKGLDFVIRQLEAQNPSKAAEFREWLDLAKDGIKGATQSVLGRDSLLPPDRPVLKAPAVAGGLPAPAPGAPAPVPNPAAPAAGAPPATPAPADAAAAPATPADPAEIGPSPQVRAMVQGFVVGTHQALVDTIDADFAAGSVFEEGKNGDAILPPLYPRLPEVVRKSIERFGQNGIPKVQDLQPVFAALASYAPQETDGLAKAIGKDANRAEWIRKFFEVVAGIATAPEEPEPMPAKRGA